MATAKFYYNCKNAPKPNRTNLIGATVCIIFENRLLLEHRKDSQRWAIIGGSLHDDESLKECAVREVWEETGIRLSPAMPVLARLYDDPSIIISYPDGNIFRSIMAVYKVNLQSEPELKCSDESTELCFFTKEELQKVRIVETHIPVLKDYLDETI